jgi:hypothetical protein
MGSHKTLQWQMPRTTYPFEGEVEVETVEEAMKILYGFVSK